MNATLYQEYVAVVQGIAEELGDVRSEDDLVLAWHERRELVRMVIDRLAPSMGQLMDREAVRDAAFCHRHREITREMGKELAAQRLEDAKRTGAEWVTLFDDVTPLGAQRLEMHVRSGRALHTSADLPLDGTRPTWELEVVQLDPNDGVWLLDRAPLLTTQKFDRQDEWEARVQQARSSFGGDHQ
ncbi:MAG TPA: hypothetical protein VL120_08225 [Solirubrobacteraceae bacterium]|nr:hypothetical protein [Solirubrobacteraceae bacterium]